MKRLLIASGVVGALGAGAAMLAEATTDYFEGATTNIVTGAAGSMFGLPIAYWLLRDMVEREQVRQRVGSYAGRIREFRSHFEHMTGSWASEMVRVARDERAVSTTWPVSEAAYSQVESAVKQFRVYLVIHTPPLATWPSFVDPLTRALRAIESGLNELPGRPSERNRGAHTTPMLGGVQGFIEMIDGRIEDARQAIVELDVG